MKKGVIFENSRIALMDGFSYYFVGSENCLAMLDGRYIRDAIRWCGRNSRKIFLVLPPVYQADIRRLGALPLHDFDGIVFNDIGTLHFLVETEYAGELVAGRLLVKAFKDPQICGYMDKLNETDRRHVRSYPVFTPWFASFLCDFGVGYVEIDAMQQGLSIPGRDKRNGLKIMFRADATFVSFARDCLSKLSSRECRSCGVGVGLRKRDVAFSLQGKLLTVECYRSSPPPHTDVVIIRAR